MSHHQPARTRDLPGPIPVAHAEFIAGAPFVFVMSGSPDEAPDVSPRGDAAGFVRLVDDVRLQLPDRLGNNRIDTIRNVLRDPRVALAFIAPDDARVLFVTGRAEILTDPALLAQFAYKDRLPRSVMDITITSSSLRPSSAFEASGFWTPERGPEASALSLGAILAEQVGGITREQGETFVANSYRNRLY